MQDLIDILDRNLTIQGSKTLGCRDDECLEACKEGWEENGDHCYLWSPEGNTWAGAEAICKEKGGHLVLVVTNSHILPI